jgi:putative lipoprotein
MSEQNINDNLGGDVGEDDPMVGDDRGFEMEDSSEQVPAGEGDGSKDKKRNTWLIVGLGALVIALIIAILAALGVFAKDDAPIIVGESWITITMPEQGDVVGVPEPVRVTGRGAGLFENNVVVQAMDSEDRVLAIEPTTLDASDPGGEGNWTVEIVIAVEPGTEGLIFVFSTSTVDGTITASASVEVIYGEKIVSESNIEITEPKDGEMLDLSKPIRVKGVGEGLFEGTVVVEALDESSNVLAQVPTIIDSPEAGVGGKGPWEVELNVETTPGTLGTIRAYSTSPKDGSVMAEAEVAVQYGDEDEATPEPTALPPDTSLKLEDALWGLASYSSGVVLEDSFITAEFVAGEVAGSAGCNNYFGPYETSGNEITIGDLGSTRKACQDPPGVMEQETAYLTTLPASSTYSIGESGLQMFDSSGAEILQYLAYVIGTVVYDQKIALPPDAVLNIQLQDVSLADAPAKVISERVISDFGQVPIPFKLAYNAAEIDTRNTYAVQARIEDGAGVLLFINTSAYNVITHDNPSDLEIQVDQVN